ncbi:Membrane protein implicated in regulation of membrane protease activity [Georgenia satyanarayanai]|uniref:Membrane protein implicated in regulation of membrane protease activity n=1 Tax=Georgenia satyanarayanai TaxID=860221 RepID=A0A2Y9BZQ8_9MICO|nr:NfeD family protein [Georgenia satyanarayanai]PYF98954.1 membrane protein implicated in regulation of membrane protease activity [Georgenia satyanarayanai]SSA44802.1 Membrane protein implicated in regulation of membrane protease activity [Georgenia satyanarayanai]
MAFLWWLGGALVLGVVEMLTVDLIFLMFAGGALAAGGVAALGAPLWAQILTFAVVSVILLVVVRPWALGYLKRSTPDSLTNVAAHVGRSAEVLVDVTDRAGRVKLAGEVWTARAAEPGSLLPTGTTVQVVRIDGATAVVAPLPVTYPEGAM